MPGHAPPSSCHSSNMTSICICEEYTLLGQRNRPATHIHTERNNLFCGSVTTHNPLASSCHLSFSGSQSIGPATTHVPSSTAWLQSFGGAGFLICSPLFTLPPISGTSSLDSLPAQLGKLPNHPLHSFTSATPALALMATAIRAKRSDHTADSMRPKAVNSTVILCPETPFTSWTGLLSCFSCS
jgi:hypothetical protein